MTLQNNHHRGFTLVETLAVMVISVMLLIVVLAVYGASLRVWRQSASRSYAFAPAYLAMTRINREVKNAMSLDIIEVEGEEEGEEPSNSVKFTVPKTDGNGVNLIPLEEGFEVTYYLADDSGTEGTSGTILWRKQVNLTNNATVLRRIATNVEKLRFTRNSTQSGRVYALYSSAVTTLGQEDSQRYISYFNSTTAFRNSTSTR